MGTRGVVALGLLVCAMWLAVSQPMRATAQMIPEPKEMEDELASLSFQQMALLARCDGHAEGPAREACREQIRTGSAEFQRLEEQRNACSSLLDPEPLHTEEEVNLCFRYSAAQEATPDVAPEAEQAEQEASPARNPEIEAGCVATLASVEVGPSHQLYAPWMEQCYWARVVGGSFTVRPAHAP